MLKNVRRVMRIASWAWPLVAFGSKFFAKRRGSSRGPVDPWVGDEARRAPITENTPATSE